MALLDDLKNKLRKLQPAANAQSAGQQQQIANALAAKGGKAAAGTTPRASTQQETAAIAAGQAAQQGVQANTNIGMAQLANADANQTAQMAGAKSALNTEMKMGQAALAGSVASGAAALKGQRELTESKLSADTEMKLQQTAAKFDEYIKNLTSEKKIQEQDIFATFAQENKLLDDRRDGAQLEQVATVLALRDKQYLDSLAEVAAIHNLESDIAFRDEATRLAMGNNLNMILNNADWQRAYNEDDRAWKRQLSTMDVNAAIQIATQQIQQSNTQAIFTGATETVKVGADYAVDSEEEDK